MALKLIPPGQRKGNKNYLIIGMEAGRQYEYSTRTTEKAVARARLEELREKIAGAPRAGKSTPTGITRSACDVMRGPCTFRRRDVVAAIKAVEASGHVVARVEIGKDGRISVVLAGQENATTVVESNEWDYLLEKATTVVKNPFDRMFDEDASLASAKPTRKRTNKRGSGKERRAGEGTKT